MDGGPTRRFSENLSEWRVFNNVSLPPRIGVPLHCCFLLQTLVFFASWAQNEARSRPLTVFRRRNGLSTSSCAPRTPCLFIRRTDVRLRTTEVIRQRKTEVTGHLRHKSGSGQRSRGKQWMPIPAHESDVRGDTFIYGDNNDLNARGCHSRSAVRRRYLPRPFRVLLI